VHRILLGDEPAFQFQHPTLAGPGNFGGWFEEKVFGKADGLPPIVDPRGPKIEPYSGPEITLDKKKYVTLSLEKRIDLTHDVRLFRFALPSKNHIVGLPVGQHIFIRAEVDGKKVMRAYTPYEAGVGFLDFVIKVYFAKTHPRFPEGGKMTQHMEAMKIGDTLDFKGPLGEYIFNTGPLRTIKEKPENMHTFTDTTKSNFVPFDALGFIAGGSGITPVLQTARALLADTSASVTIKILFANRSESDILCKEMLDSIDALPNVEVWYTVDTLDADTRTTPGEWKYSKGFIDEAMVRDHLPTPGPNTYIFCCGPPPMINFACKPNLEKVGHAASRVHCF